MNNSEKLFDLGQSIWYDNIDRNLLNNGELARMILSKEIFGVTSNPSIFEKAITSGHDYDDNLRSLATSGFSIEEIYNLLVVEDIQMVADLFSQTYAETKRKDGYVSLEVSPLLAQDTENTIKEARALWKQVNRPNLMVKIPATKEGIPAIRALISDGININATLIFSIKRYREVMEAYISGLEDRVIWNKPLNGIHSVASFFVSRIDTAVDNLLEEMNAKEPELLQTTNLLLGTTAISNARIAYQEFLAQFFSDRFSKLVQHGANIQRPLWASTGTKNKAYSDVIYVDNLIAPLSVNTAPPETIQAFLDHGNPELTIGNDLQKAHENISFLHKLGVNLDVITKELEKDGVYKFEKSYMSLLSTIETRRNSFIYEK